MATEGGALSTTMVDDGLDAALLFPAKSEAVLAAIEILRFPLPIKLVSSTVGLAVLPFLTVIVAVGPPIRETSAGVRLNVLAPEYVIPKETVPELFTLVAEGAPIDTVGGVLSTTTSVELTVALLLPALSVAVLAAIAILRFPLPVRFDKVTVGLFVFPLVTETFAVGVPTSETPAGVRLTVFAPV